MSNTTAPPIKVEMLLAELVPRNKKNKKRNEYLIKVALLWPNEPPNSETQYMNEAAAIAE